MRRGRWSLAFLLGVSAACDDGGGGGGGITAETTCAVVLVVSGDLEAELTAASSVACASQLGSEGLDVEYLPVEGELEYVSLVVDALTKGDTGTFAARVRVRHEDGRDWQAGDCSVEIDEHTFLETAELGERHRVHGVATCPAPVSGDPGGALTIEPFEFAASVTWTA